ncbi:MAG: 8-amino-7-oxononanoate synthase [Cytophagales bacterium]|nr:8-amino-7-oxononanoate synthase [Bernardetiaceae bacterium]MDW8211429.1 8-amino-7-oxononanoate synthase [Cytophagales bacterium]
MLIEERIKKELRKREEQGNLRTLQPEKEGIDFFSNDYLGLARSKELAGLIEERYRALPRIRLGATGSRLLSGNSSLAMQLETQLAQLFQGEAALLFNSGYVANMALLSAVAQKGDVIIYDELVHASLREGYRLSFADRTAFRHNDLADLEYKIVQLQRSHPNGCLFVVTESVFSMDGDNAVLADMVALCQHYGVYLIIDEAHSTGIFGQGGSGLACQLNLHNHFLARVYTFGKAVGVHGACVVGSQWLIDYLVNFARPFIYSTALPDHTLVSIATAFDYIQAHPLLIEQLHRNIRYYCQAVQEIRLPSCVQLVCNQSPVQVVIVPGNASCKALARWLEKEGFLVLPILSPTVPAGMERLRICLHAFNTEEQICKLVETINQFFR